MKTGVKCLLLAAAVGAFGAGAVHAQNTGRIEGIAQTASGEAATDASVRIVGLTRLVDVDDRGAFVFEDVPAGDYILDVRSVQWGNVDARVTVFAGETANVIVQIIRHIHLGEVIISAGPVALNRSDAVLPTDVLDNEELLAADGITIGDALGDRPGIASTYFGPGASRPLIRGLGGNRVRVLQQGIGVADASEYSPDHAVAIETLTANRIEVVRGPATLLYGSSAIGGVVNVLDGRVPNELPTQRITGTATIRGGTAALERTGMFKLQGAASDHIAWIVSLLRRETDDYSIPGAADADHDEEEGEHEEEEEETHGVLKNSAVATANASVGLSWVGDNGYLGGSFTYLTSHYGVPGHSHQGQEGDEHDEEEHEEENGHDESEDAGTYVDMIQNSFDIEGSWRFGSPMLRGIRVRFGASDYAHDEVEGDRIETTFDNEQLEARIELDHRLAAGNNGVIGVQMERRDLAVVGHEEYIPATKTNKLAVFALERFETGALILEAGLRYESVSLSPTTSAKDRSFSGVSVSGGVNYGPNDRLSLALSASRSVKMPAAGELYANGPHVATRAFEIGSEDLSSENALSLDASLHLHMERADATISVFNNSFSDFIYLRPSADMEDGFIVYRIEQNDATFRGFEAEADIELLHAGEGHLMARVWADLTRAELSDGSHLPRIPPFRAGGGLRWVDGRLEVNASVRSVSGQERTAAHERETEGHTTVDASASWRLFSGSTAHIFTLSGKNLTNEEIRLHTSYLKELAPLPGRDIRLSYRFIF